MSFSVGIDVNAVVADVGSMWTRIGLAGHDSPAAWFPTAIGVHGGRDEPPGVRATHASDDGEAAGGGAGGAGAGGDLRSRKRARYDLNIDRPSAGLEIRSPLHDGLVEDWDALELLWENAVEGRLGLKSREHPVMLAEPALAPKADRERWAELLFETFEAPGFFVSKQGILTCYANARTSGLVIDVGHHATTVTPVQDGYPLMMGVRRNLVAGQAMEEFWAERLAAHGTAIRPRYAVRKVVSGLVDANGDRVIDEVRLLGHEGITDSFRRFHELSVIREAKEATIRLADRPFDETNAAHMPNHSFELPDGSVLAVDADRFRMAELLFDPTPVAARVAGALPLPRLVVDSIMASDLDFRRELLLNVLVTGGCAAIAGLPDRLLNEMTEVAALPFKTRIQGPAGPERSLGAWLGGSILGSLGTFPDLWVSRDEYREHGAAILHRKCP